MMRTLPEKTMEAYRVKKIPNNIKFVFDEAFAAKGAKNKFNEFNPNLPGTYGPKLLLPRDQERELFLKFNYAKYRASGIVNHRSVKRWLTKASYYKDVIAYHNLKLAYSMVIKLCKYGNSEELEGAALFGLCKAIDGFDAGRGNKFSTYATWAIRTHVWRHKQKVAKHAHEDLEYQYGVSDPRSKNDTYTADAAVDVAALLDNSGLTSTERFVIASRFGLGSLKPATYLQLGVALGVSKTYIQHILSQALRKINISYDREQKTQIRIDQAKAKGKAKTQAKGQAKTQAKNKRAFANYAR